MVMQTKMNQFTEPKLSPAKPKSSDMSTDWYVWFRFFDFSKGKWKQLRIKKGINQIKNYKTRLLEANALKQVIKEELQKGWNPLTGFSIETIKIYSLQTCIDFIMKIKCQTLRTKSSYAYRYITKIFTSWLKVNGLLDLNVNSFTGSHAQRYMDWLLISKNYSGRTFNDHLIVLRTFFNCFIDREWISKNPFRTVKRKTQTVGRNLAFTDQERKLLSDYLYRSDRRLWYFTQFMFHTFIRRTELTTLQVKHIDIRNSTIIIPGAMAKNNTQESVVIPIDLEPVITEMKLDQLPPDHYVFGRGLLTGALMFKNPNHISTRHNSIVKGLQINAEKGLYSWKHTGACAYYYAAGKDIHAIMRQLRHRDLNTTMIYLKSLGLVQNNAFRYARVA